MTTKLNTASIFSHSRPYILAIMDSSKEFWSKSTLFRLCKLLTQTFPCIIFGPWTFGAIVWQEKKLGKKSIFHWSVLCRGVQSAGVSRLGWTNHIIHPHSWKKIKDTFLVLVRKRRMSQILLYTSLVIQTVKPCKSSALFPVYVLYWRNFKNILFNTCVSFLFTLNSLLLLLGASEFH